MRVGAFACGAVALLGLSLILAAPSADEQRYFNALAYRYNLYTQFANTSIEEARGTLGAPLVITFPCPNPPPSSGRVTITTHLVNWSPGGEPVGSYAWSCLDYLDNNVKVAECDNEIAFDLSALLPERSVHQQAGNVRLYYHEWLHGQLMIDTMRTPEWQAQFCNCSMNLSGMDSEHDVIGPKDTAFLDALWGYIVNLPPNADPWNDHGNASDSDGDGIDNSVDQCLRSFDLTAWIGLDADGDGFGYSCDCNDANPGINPAQWDRCYNDVDDNCDGIVNEGCRRGSSPLFRKFITAADDYYG